MKTTVNLDEDLMRAAKERARRRGITLTALISHALRRELAEESGRTEFRVDLPATHGTRAPTVDVESNAALEEYLDQSDLRHRIDDRR